MAFSLECLQVRVGVQYEAGLVPVLVQNSIWKVCGKVGSSALFRSASTTSEASPSSIKDAWFMRQDTDCVALTNYISSLYVTCALESGWNKVKWFGKLSFFFSRPPFLSCVAQFSCLCGSPVPSFSRITNSWILFFVFQVEEKVKWDNKNRHDFQTSSSTFLGPTPLALKCKVSWKGTHIQIKCWLMSTKQKGKDPLKAMPLLSSSPLIFCGARVNCSWQYAICYVNFGSAGCLFTQCLLMRKLLVSLLGLMWPLW